MCIITIKSFIKFVEKIGEPMPMFEGQFMMPVPSTKVCPNDDLSMNIAVEYIFLEDFVNFHGFKGSLDYRSRTVG